MFVLVFVKVTVAAGTTDPLESVTTPETPPVVRVWAKDSEHPISRAPRGAQKERRTLVCGCFGLSPGVLIRTTFRDAASPASTAIRKTRVGVKRNRIADA